MSSASADRPPRRVRLLRQAILSGAVSVALLLFAFPGLASGAKLSDQNRDGVIDLIAPARVPHQRLQSAGGGGVYAHLEPEDVDLQDGLFQEHLHHGVAAVTECAGVLDRLQS